MQRITAASILAFSIGWLIIAVAGSVSPPDGQFQVNRLAAGNQDFPDVAVAPNGDFVIVWESGDVLARRFDSSGAPLGGDILVNTYATEDPARPDVAMDSAGNFVVTWRSGGSAESDTGGRSVQARRFDSSGAPDGGQFQLDAYAARGHGADGVAFAGDGSFVVVWHSFGSGTDTESFGIQAQRYDSDGSPIGSEFQVNTYTTDSQRDARAAFDENGNLVVVWTSYGSSGTDAGGDASIQGQVFDAAGDRVGGELQINTYTTGDQTHASLAFSPNGDLIVAWSSLGSPGKDRSGRSIQARRFAGPLTDPLRLTVTGVFNDEDLDGDADPGETVDYVYELTYPDRGLAPRTDVRVSDPDVAPILCPSGNPLPVLRGGASETCTGTYVLTQADADAGRKDTLATAVSAEAGPRTAAASVPLGQSPAVDLVKTGLLDLGGNGTADAGDLIHYLLDVTNTGNVTLSNLEVVDPLVGPVTCPGGNPMPSLAPGGTETCTASYAVTRADVDAGLVLNTATVSADEPGGEKVDAQDSHGEPIPRAPFACDGTVYIVHEIDAVLSRIDRETSPFTFVDLAGPLGREINNLGFNPADGLLYGVELNAGGNTQLVQVDASGSVFGLGRPAGLPSGFRFDGGDVSADGSTFYVLANNSAVYQVALPALTVTSVPRSGASGNVFDWAYNPADGLLYGGDSTSGQLAVLDPDTGVRTDSDLAGLPGGSAYGGAWFDVFGRLFLYRNNGEIYEVDLSGPTVVDVATGGPSSTRNDGAACVGMPPTEPAIELVKTGALDDGGDGFADPGDVIDYSFEITNTGNVPLTDVTLSDPIVSPIGCPSGHPIASLAPGAAETCSGSYTLLQADVDAGVKDNTATVDGDDPGGDPVTDQDSHSEPLPTFEGEGPRPFACTGDAYIVQDQNAQLTRVDPSVSPFVFVPIGAATGIEINNLGFRSTDGLLYAVELNPGGNVQIVQIDANGNVFGLGRPAGLPAGPRFDAGDVSPDGTTMYVTSNNQDLYVLDLALVPTLPAVTSVAVTGATGFVFDWAVSPLDGKLYGGDSSHGQLAILDPATGVRTDVDVSGLPSGSSYGGAWFDAAGTLFLYQNQGVLYEIDLAGSGLPGPTVVDTQTGPGASRNDGAACIDQAPPAAALGLIKSGALDLGGNGTTDAGDLIHYTFQVTNTGTDALTNVTLSDPIVAPISCPGSHPIPFLAAGASVICTASYAIAQADVDARVRDNTATATGSHASGPVSAEASHSQPIPAPPGTGPVPFACSGDAYLVQNQDAQLTRVDPSVSPFVFVPIGPPAGIEINNLGFRSTDGLLYALELTSGGNVQIVRIDATGTVTGLGRPPGLPSGPRFDAGDVSPDGTTMYFTSNNQALFRLDLTSVPALPPVTSVAVTGATGFVFDWAVSPIDGKLYGGDSSHGQLAILDPATGVRTDVAVAGLPGGAGYGGAWFGDGGTLFLYQNDGNLYEIDLDGSGLPGPTVVDTQTGPGASRNDGAACVELPPPAAALSLVKTGALDLGGNGATDVGDLIDYTFEVTNTGTDALTDVTLSDPVASPIFCPGGHPILFLASGATAICSASYAITQADVDARVRDNTASVTGAHDSGPVTAQDSHSEPIPLPEGAGPVPFACTGDAYIVQNENAELALVDRTVSPFVFVPVGAPTGIEINNMGFRSTDGLLYAVELIASGNVQVVRIDATGAVFGLGRPPGLPSLPRFDLGDVSPDGTTMYITSNNQPLYRLDLTSVPLLPAVTQVRILGASGHVFDWAVSPIDGKLYGGDSTSGQLAILDPATGIRTDLDVAGLPNGSGYGGAWFDNRGRLFLYRNAGAIYEIDLAGPTVLNVQTGPGASRNDAAACIPERQVNTFTLGDQTAASMGMTPDGDFVVVWQSDGSSGTDGSGTSIQGQRYASSGASVGSEFQVNRYTTGDQEAPAVAMDADGDFVVVWHSPAAAPGSSIQGRRYASNGSAVGAQFRVDVYDASDNLHPAVAMDADGDFVVVWQSDGAGGYEVQGQRYASDGSAVGGKFQVNTYSTGGQGFPTVAMDADGDFVVVWTSDGSPGTDSSFYSVQGQRYASDGAAAGGQFQVNAYTTNPQRFPSVAMDQDGDFVVVWDSRGSGGNDNLDSYSIQGRRYASNGAAAGGQFQVNTYTTNNQRLPSVSLDTNGDFVVVWDSRGSSGTDSSHYSIQGQRFASNGSTIGRQFQVNNYTPVFQIRPSVSSEANGDFVVVWDSTGSRGTDSSGRSIQKANGILVP
jgi:hypothetical protein